MSFDTISIFFVLMSFAICDANIQGAIGNAHPSDPYKITGLWYVVATIGYDTSFTQPKCWNVTIAMSSQISFIGTLNYFNVMKGRGISEWFNATKSEKYLYPSIFDISKTHTEHIVQASQMVLYENYLYDYSIWHWVDSAGNDINSLVVSRNPKLSEEETDSLRHFYPNVKLIDNNRGLSCSANVDDRVPSNVASSDDPFKIRGTWYVAAYKTSIVLPPQIRCWIVKLSTSDSSLYAGVSVHSVDETSNRIVSTFKAEQFKNWTYIVKFHVTWSDNKNQMYSFVAPFKSYIYNYSIWASVEKTYFDYLVVSRNPILSEEEINSLGGVENELNYINNIHSDACPSREMELPQPRNSSNDEITGKSINNWEDVLVDKHHKPSRAHRPSITISFFVLSSMFLLKCVR